MIRKKIVEYKNNDITFEELKTYTEPKYIDGVKVLDACVYAARYIDKKLLVTCGDSSGMGLNCKMANIIGKEYLAKVFSYDTILNVCVISPILSKKEILGYDILYSKCSKVLKDILSDEQNF